MVKNMVTCMVIGLPDGYPPSNDISREIVYIVNDVSRTKILCLMSYTYENEYESLEAAERMLKNSMKRCNNVKRKDMLTTEDIVELFLHDFLDDEYLSDDCIDDECLE